MLHAALVALLFAAQSTPPIRPAPFPAPRPTPPAPIAPIDNPAGDERPRLTFLPDPSIYYPPAALAEEREGTTLLRCTLTQEGTLVDCGVHQSSGSPDLDTAAFQIAARARYTPMRVAGKAVKATVVLPVRWVIGD